MSALAACTGSTGEGPAGSTEFNVLVPDPGNPDFTDPASPWPSQGAFDITEVAYTIVCADDPNDGFGDTNRPFDGTTTIQGELEVVDNRMMDIDGDGNDEPTEIWQTFMDLPPAPPDSNPGDTDPEDNCTVYLRALDANGEVLCNADDTFRVEADTTQKVYLTLVCDGSYQPPVGSVDVDGTFSFIVGNFCPDLFVLNAIPSAPEAQSSPIGQIAVTEIQTRYRDADDTCGTRCDPQTCDNSVFPPVCNRPTGLPLTAMITSSAANDGWNCDVQAPGLPTSGGCPFTGINAGLYQNWTDPACDQGTGTGCIPADSNGAITAPNVTYFCELGVGPQDITVLVSDGDDDCNKTKSITVDCPGVNACLVGTPCAPANDCQNSGCTPSTDTSGNPLAICDNSPIATGLPGQCTSNPGAGTGFSGICDGGATPVPPAPGPNGGLCVDVNFCVPPAPAVDCNDGNDCTTDGSCIPQTGGCTPATNVTDCTGCCLANLGDCVSGVCQGVTDPPPVAGTYTALCDVLGQVDINFVNNPYEIDAAFEIGGSTAQAQTDGDGIATITALLAAAIEQLANGGCVRNGGTLPCLDFVPIAGGGMFLEITGGTGNDTSPDTGATGLNIEVVPNQGLVLPPDFGVNGGATDILFAGDAVVTGAGPGQSTVDYQMTEFTMVIEGIIQLGGTVILSNVVNGLAPVSCGGTASPPITTEAAANADCLAAGATPDPCNNVDPRDPGPPATPWGVWCDAVDFGSPYCTLTADVLSTP
jgi:hypothetical protein